MSNRRPRRPTRFRSFSFHRYAWGFPHSGQNLLVRGMGLPHSPQNFVLGEAAPEVAAPAAAGVAPPPPEPADFACFTTSIIACPIATPAPIPPPMPTAPPPSSPAAIGIACAT